ncbi:hypothetical protein J6590_091428 [Homalodisca vitripennis]|nr:hypothetical protein J6590_091428 [Homalodisca vitripennis]
METNQPCPFAGRTKEANISSKNTAPEHARNKLSGENERYTPVGAAADEVLTAPTPRRFITGAAARPQPIADELRPLFSNHIIPLSWRRLLSAKWSDAGLQEIYTT